MPDWHGTTGRDDLVGGGQTQYSTTIEDITLCSVEPFTEDEKKALAEYFRTLRKARDVASPSQPKTCKGFQWVGQSFKYCNECGLPFWEHEYDSKLKDGAGPFDDEPFEYVPITDEQRAACKARWENT
jgi:hypothetical protein